MILQSLINLDNNVSAKISTVLAPVSGILKQIKRTANQSSYWLVILFLWFVARMEFFTLIYLTGSIVVVTGLLMLLKLKVKRERPKAKKQTSHIFDSYSFPSGHATRVTLITVFAAFSGVNLLAVIFLAFWSFMVCVERVVSEEHFLTDVVGGSIIGLLMGKGAFITYHWIIGTI